MKKKIIFTILILTFGISIGYAAEMILGTNVSFNNGKTNLKATSVQEAIEEIYKNNRRNIM